MTPNSLFKLSPLMLALAAGTALAAELKPADNFKVFDQVTLRGDKIDKANLPSREYVADQYIVEFNDSPVAASSAVAVSSSTTTTSTSSLKPKINFASSAVKSHRAKIKSEQATAISSLGRKYPGAKVKRQYNVVFNGMVVQGKGIDMAQLKALPNVKAVYRDEVIQVKMDQSLPIINAPEAWAELGGRSTAGQGIRVAVVDSGIRPENPMFDDAGMPAPTDLPDDDYCHTTDPSFCNNKLIVARYYTASSSTASYEYTDSPLGWNGHGTHVAGTAVGVPVQVTYGAGTYDISGVAPGAYLMAYKALYYNGSTASGLGSSLISAVEDAVADGADVINNSWGGSAGGDPNQSAYKEVWENAEAAGVVVVSAAGNDGNSESTIGCPGCVESGITVANTQTGRSFVETLTVDGLGDFNAVEGTSSVQFASVDDSALTGSMIAASTIDSANVEGCDAFPDDAFAGSYALISRGSCTFTVKADNAAAAGAIGMVVYNSASGAPIIMSMDDATIPAVMVSQDDGATLETAAAEGALNITIDPDLVSYVDPSLVDVMNSSSSRGPNGDNSFIKPDLAAPGTNILSAYSPDEAGDADTQFAVLTGTSMASPHVAGSAALVLAAHPDWTPAEVKSALVNTSNTAVLDDDGETPATPFAMGAGRLDVSQAINSALALAPVSLSGPDCVSACSFEVDTTSLVGYKASWTGAVSFENSTVSGSLSVDGHGHHQSANAMSLKAGGSGSFTVAVDTSLADRDQWYFGEVTFTDQDGKAPMVHMPIAVYAGNSTDATVLSSTAGSTTPGVPVAAQTVFTNKSISDAATVSVSFPDTVTVASEPVATVTNATQSSFAYDASSKTATWTGTVNEPLGSLETGPSWLDSLPSLTDGFSPYTLSCSTSCDEGTLTLSLSSYGLSFMGQSISTLTLGTNGYIAFNGGSVSSSYYNDTMPSSRVSGAVLAPFWTDLDMTSTGGWYYQFITDGSDYYLVFEWKDVPLYDDDSGNTYTFQVLFKLNSDDVYVHYVSMGDMPENVTAGLQDASAVGSSLYVDGSGTVPASGTSFEVSHQAGGSVSLDYSVSASSLTAADDTLETSKGEAASIDLLSGLSGSRHAINSAVSGGSVSETAEAVLVVSPDGEAAAVSISSQPKHGKVTVADGTATYTPFHGYTGTDSFSYTLTDESGNASEPGTVTVTVTGSSNGHPGHGDHGNGYPGHGDHGDQHPGHNDHGKGHGNSGHSWWKWW
ncbi:S8 family serine peptidase [Gallaecimonas mangrovi]|uniref:S8 family serine peptidase n=1 Tax=Gallaecimonas mangrovi TaxID=2291597 RepID=UPI000E1FE995|nr:S8 family serine peptidase [Gallaecimonas mangrovi]